MKLLIVVGDMNIKSGGVTRTLLNLIDNLTINYKDIKITLACTYAEKNDLVLSNTDVKFVSFKRYGPQKFGFSPDLNLFLKDNIMNYSLIHFHGVWDHCILFAAKLAINNKIPYIFSTHGMLDNWSMAQSYYSKRLWMLANNVNYVFSKASAFIFSTDQEKIETLSYFKFIKSYFIVQNGLNATEYNFDKLKSRELVIQRFNTIKPSSKVFVYSARIHEKKNPLSLLKAFHNLSMNNNDIKLLFLGIADDLKLCKELTTYINSNKLNDDVFLSLDIFGKEAIELISGCDFFVLPSFQEGFSVAIIEALACGLPVVISKKCNFSDVETYNAGFITDVTEKSIEISLDKCQNLSQDEYHKMTKNAKDLILQKYTQSHISEKLISIYKQVSHYNA